LIGHLKNIFAIKDLRNRIFFTLVFLAIYRIGAFIPTPGINGFELQNFIEKTASNTLLGIFNMFSGGALSRLTIFALGIMPYISASIILELLTVVVPALERLKKEGELGRKKITQYTRYLTVGLSLVQSFAIAAGLEKMQGGIFVNNPGWGFRLTAMITLTAGTVFIMWLGEQISERGIGNGISLIITAGIVARIPSMIYDGFKKIFEGTTTELFSVLVLLALMLVVIGFIVFMELSQRRIPVQYAKKVVGRKIYGGQSTHLPLKLNPSGVIPAIFASSIIMFPVTIEKFLPAGSWLSGIVQQISPGKPLYMLIYGAAIIFFAYFYTSIIFNPQDVADNMKKYGGFIPGKRPGKRTADYIDKILSKITFVGALYLTGVVLVPSLLSYGFQVQYIPFIGEWIYNLGILPKFITQGLGVPMYFSGTSMLIAVGVTLETSRQIESQLLMRHYGSFMKTRKRRRTKSGF